jgi:hypothetical protein
MVRLSPDVEQSIREKAMLLMDAPAKTEEPTVGSHTSEKSQSGRVLVNREAAKPSANLSSTTPAWPVAM